MNKKQKGALAIACAAAVLYNLSKKSVTVNKLYYKNAYDAALRYAQSKYTNVKVGPVEKQKGKYVCCATHSAGKTILVFFKTKDGEYVFDEVNV